DRDTAILLCLLDTGARASEFLSVNLDDINQARGDILIIERELSVQHSKLMRVLFMGYPYLFF
ncbi:MAG: hypothetical protein NTY79_09285, partial [Chloroflexi bacterium]|nr:hypothetical protein [Chloroflexota bacterium]